MGHEQLWRIKNLQQWQAVWPRLVADTRLIVEAADLDTTSDRIWDLHEVDSDENGYEAAMQKLLYPPPPVMDEEEGIHINGIHTDGCEPFVLHRDMDVFVNTETYQSHSCKTNQRPYDVVATAVLMRAKQLLGGAFTALWHEGDHGWEQARHIVSRIWPDVEIPHADEDEWDEPFNPDEKPLADHADHLGIAAKEPAFSSDYDSEPLRELPLPLSPSIGDMMARWIRESRAAPNNGQNVRGKHLPLMRLIDVNRLCVVPAPRDADYVALSYVWGTGKQAKLTQDNIESLMQNGGLESQGIQLPRTISESMALCQRLGYRYLWVDALCIVQDSSQDKLFQLNSMRDVYKNASLTFVAAAGSSADSGLGLGGRECSASVETTTTECDDIEASLKGIMDDSAWEARAWTFQEKALSRRLLIFTTEGPFYNDGDRIYSERGFQTIRAETAVLERPGGLYTVEQGRQLETYLDAVQRYSTRQLSFQADFANAMKGITRAFGYAMDGSANGFLAGVPTCVFDQLFDWRVAAHEPGKRRRGFESWSWQGWQQTPLFPPAVRGRVRRGFLRRGSRMLQRDRVPGGTDYDDMAPHGINDSGPMELYLHVKGGALRLGEGSTRDVGPTNGVFDVSCPRSGARVGEMQLDKRWRAGRSGDDLLFAPVVTEGEGEEERIKVIMCLRSCADDDDDDDGGDEGPSKRWAPKAFTYERVQVMDCDVGRDEWVKMMGGSMPDEGIWIA